MALFNNEDKIIALFKKKYTEGSCILFDFLIFTVSKRMLVFTVLASLARLEVFWGVRLKTSSINGELKTYRVVTEHH